MAEPRYKPPGNYRLSPSRTPSPESIDVIGGFAVLCEAPANPGDASTPMVVTINGASRTRVTTTPGIGEYRIVTQSVYGQGGAVLTEFLSLLEFNAADEGKTGTADYYRTGATLTAQFFDRFVDFLTPLVGYSAPGLLPAATTDVTSRGRKGDVAFLTDGSIYISDGVTWNAAGSSQPNRGLFYAAHSFAAAFDSSYSAPPTGDLAVAHTFAASFSYGYTDPPVYSGAESDAITFAAAFAGTYSPPGTYSGDLTAAHAFAATFDGSYAGAGAQSGSFTAPHTFAAAHEGSYSAGGGSVSVSDNFNRADGPLGSNWTATSGRSMPSITNNCVAQTSGLNRGAYWSADTFTGNHFSQATIGGDGNVVCVRMSGANCYGAAWEGAGDGEGATWSNVVLQRLDGDTPTILGRYDGLSDAAHVVRLEVVGSTLTVKVDGVTRITATDATYSGGAPGIRAMFAGSIDDWSGGDI